jgi:amidase
MKLSEYASHDGLALAELVRTREVSARELAQTALRAIDALNPQLNAVIGTVPDETERALGALSSLPPGAPFLGVPFLIKDIGSHFANVTTELGSRFMHGLVLPFDNELAVRFKQAGVVAIGRSNVPEFGANVSTEPVKDGPTHNPWNLRHSPGGSSGGSAAAVAAGIVPVAHANDGGGSIRAPASCCGLFGLKPSRHRNPFGPDQDEGIFGLGVEHIVSRTVRDSAAMLDATHGADVGARYLLKPPEIPFAESARRDPGKLRIAFSTRAPAGAPDVHSECRTAVLNAAKLCERLGHDVFEAAPDVTHEETCSIFRDVAGPYLAAAFAAASAAMGRTVGPDTVEATTRAIIALSRRLGHFFETCDVWLSPVLTTPPPLLGVLDANDESLDARAWIRKIMDTCAFCAMFNGSGQPAMSVPLHWSADGLPVGVHFVGRFGDESTLFSLAGQLERAQPWIARIPPISARRLD